MCGICGFNWENKELLRLMNAVLTHRGPDGEGFYLNKNISLGHRRLSIIDLSSAGKQPMCNETETIWISFNGEIYNFKELRIILEQKGHRFKSNTDTEVIVHGYEEWGEKVVEKMNGEFAFAIWDCLKKKLFLARDRLGIKPLYYYWDGKRLIFASEIKAILLSGVKREVNLNSARTYLQFRYISGEETLFQGIKKLLPGFTLTLQKQKININQFWDVPIPKIKHHSLESSGRELKELLIDSVKRRLVADVPVGIYLSGGLDSAAITAIASSFKKSSFDNEPVKTFSAGFGTRYDELAKAKIISDHFNTDHHEIIVDRSIKEMIPKIIWHFDMPHGDPVIIPQFKLSELAAQKVKVVLAGEGSDEIFGGYVQYKALLKAQKIKQIPFKSEFAKLIPIKVLDKFFDYSSSIGQKGKEKFLELIQDLNDDKKAYLDLTSITSHKDERKLFSERLNKNQSELNNYFVNSPRKTLLNKMLYQDIKEWLPHYILYINDRMTLAHSIEGRVPFLDHRIVEYSTTLSNKYKINHSVTKVILREAMKKILPNTQTKKQAFFMPLDKWYKEELKDLAENLFTPANVKQRGYFEYNYLQKVWNNYPQSKLIYGKQLFTLINFELWQRMFIDAEKIPLNNNMKLSSLI